MVRFCSQKVLAMPRSNRGFARKSNIQILYELCVETFSAPSKDYAPEAVERLRNFLDTIRAVDVGIKEIVSIQDPVGNRSLEGRVPSVSNRGRRTGHVRRPPRRAGTPPATNYVHAPAITYVHVYECDNFSIGIFCLPASAVLPLHNHPGMTVLSKLLYGSLHLKSYDIVSDCPAGVDRNSAPQNSELAKTKVDRVYNAPCEPTMLSPRIGGTIHCLTAVTACAVLDVLAPPYSDKDGRHCTYYRVSPCLRVQENGTTESKDMPGYSWLEEIEMPDDVLIRGGKYQGPELCLREKAHA